MGSSIIGGSDKNKTGETAHRIHDISFATIISDVIRGPEIGMEKVEGTAEGPWKDKLAATGESTPLAPMQWTHWRTQSVMSLRQPGQKNRRRCGTMLCKYPCGQSKKRHGRQRRCLDKETMEQ